MIYLRLDRHFTSQLRRENQYQNDIVRFLLQNSSDKMDARFREFEDKNDVRSREFDTRFREFEDKNDVRFREFDTRFRDFTDKIDAQLREIHLTLQPLSSIYNLGLIVGTAAVTFAINNLEKIVKFFNKFIVW